MPSRIDRILLIGASRGLGLGLAGEFLSRGATVVATRRGASSGLEALAREHPAALRLEHVDINIPAEIAALRETLAGQRFDLLFINAGVSSNREAPITTVDDAEIARLFTTNAVNPIRTADALVDLVPEGGTIGFMSSILGSVAGNTTGGYELYRASKAALNTFARSFAVRHAKPARSVILMHPGWVRTDMGGPDAPLDVASSVRGMADALTDAHGRGGQAYLDYEGKTLPW